MFETPMSVLIGIMKEEIMISKKIAAVNKQTKFWITVFYSKFG
jgi:hypothetical protein